MSVTGETGYSSAGRSTYKADFSPIPAGDYELLLLGTTAEVRIADGAQSSGLPYVAVAFEAMGTSEGENGRNRRVFTNLILSLEIGEKTGRPIVDQANQLLGLSKAVGVPLEFGEDAIITRNKRTREGATVSVKLLDPQQVKDWITALDGNTLRAHIKVRRASEKDKDKGYSDKNEIAYFIEASPDATTMTTDTTATNGRRIRR